MAQRTREIGISVALGATTRAIVGLVVREGARPVLEGLGLGLATAVVVRFMMTRELTTPVGAIDPFACVVCALLLGAAGIVACWRPARRAARVSPMTALRDR